MKKTLSVLLILIILLSGLFLLTGCDNNQNVKNVNKDYQTYEIQAKFGKLTFELPKDSGYELTTENNSGKLYKVEDKSSIEFFMMDTSKSGIIMKEKDFYSESYHDYIQTEIAGHQAYSIKYGENFRVS